jgi:hypothetical protein
MNSLTYINLTTLNLPDIDISELDNVEWFYVNFQGALMCSLYNTRIEGNWVQDWVLPETSKIRQTIESIIFPFIGGKGNVTVIKTVPGEKLNHHIDSAAKEYGTEQYKFRWVIKGRTDTLFFFDANEEKHFIPNIDTYIINGAHPHGMENNGTDDKYTLCIGAPWKPNEQFLTNIELFPKNYLSLPKLKKEWTDPRIEENKKNVLGSTFLKVKN